MTILVSRALVAVAALVGMAGCGGGAAGSEGASGVDVPPTDEAAALAVEAPEGDRAARPGQELELSTIQDVTVGWEGYVLERWSGETWELDFLLAATRTDDDEPVWVRPGEELPGLDDAMSGVGPVGHVIIPPPTEAGWYRICYEVPPETETPCTSPFDVRD